MKINKQYMAWIRELSSDYFFIRYGKSFRQHRADFLRGETPSYSAFKLVPF